MNISRGELIERYAALFEVPINEAVHWVSSYVNRPELFENQHLIEKTEKERFASIKAYVERRIGDTADHRIRKSIALEKEKAA